jgi:hypothetical protein
MSAINFHRSCAGAIGATPHHRVTEIVISLAGAAMLAIGAGVPCAPSATAQPEADIAAQLESAFASALDSARGATQCSAFQSDPAVNQVAGIVNRSTSDYVVHQARHVPVTDPVPILRDVGSNAAKAIMLQGQAFSPGDAIKGAVLQGYAVISDCSYDRFGVSIIVDSQTGRTYAAALLTGM